MPNGVRQQRENGLPIVVGRALLNGDFKQATKKAGLRGKGMAGRPSTSWRGLRRAADENLPLTLSLSPAIPAARGMGEGTSESAARLSTGDPENDQ